MTRIQVQTEQLESLGGMTQRVSETLREWNERLAQALGTLDWSVRQRDGVDEMSRQAHLQANQLGEQATQWSQFLREKARLFADTDQGLAQSLAKGTAPGGGAVNGGAAANSGQPVITSPPGKGTSITGSDRWVPVDASRTSSVQDRAAMDEAARKARYIEVLDQFNVTGNPRYLPTKQATYCNIFVTDATRAMGAEIPHWVNPDGSPTAPGTKGANELDANETVDWLEKHGGDYGWRPVSAAEAQNHANDGRPAVAVMEKPGAIGHVAMVRPGTYDQASGPRITNVGAHNKTDCSVADQFGRTDIRYFVHE